MTLFICTLWGLAGCGREKIVIAPASSAKKAPANLVVISLDTLRADRLGCYGHHLPVSPFLDTLSRNSVLMTDVLAQNPATILSHRAIFTGLYVHQQSPGPAPAASTLAGRLAQAGYTTAAFTDGGLMHANFGNNPGFGLYNDEAGGAAAVFRRCLDWIDSNPAKPFFVFLHTYDIHYPYTPPAPFDNMFLPPGDSPYHLGADHGKGYWNKLSLERDEFVWISRRYDGGVRSTDREVMRLLSELKDRGLMQNTSVVVLSDHGESLGERLYVGHHDLYDAQLQVPLLIMAPGWNPRVVDGAFETVDILPTILDLFSVPRNDTLPGRSLAETIRKGLKPGHDRPRLSETWARTFRLGPDWKLILRATSEEDELYRRDSDPDELRNLAAEHPDIADGLRQSLAGFTGEPPEDIRKRRKQREMPMLLSAKDGKAEESTLMNQLRELGYME